MRPIETRNPDLPPREWSFAASIGAILELPAQELPRIAGDHLIAQWHSWLGARGLGLVPIEDPASLSWPGPWVALLESGTAAVAYGGPPGIAWDPLGGDEDFGAVRGGLMIAPHHVAHWTPPEVGDGRTHGHVELIALAPAAEAPMVVVERVQAVAGRGLEGDRYFTGEGTFSRPGPNGLQLTLVEAEQLDAVELAYPDARRNLVTRGIDLDALVGRRFTVGEVECIAQRPCEPCSHLQRLTRPGVLRALVHRGGIRADVLRGGTIETGAAVTPAYP